MPRGGKRPGAGAPRGNFNALKRGNHSPRVRFVLSLLRFLPEAREVAYPAVRRAGFYVPLPGKASRKTMFNGDVRAVVDLLYPLLFDRPAPAKQPNAEAVPPPRKPNSRFARRFPQKYQPNNQTRPRASDSDL